MIDLEKSQEKIYSHTRSEYISSIANLNSTLMWNLILQIHLLSIVEFILSEPSVKIMVINMTVSSQREGTTYG